jgi:D-beta-D-heptose 7-phosphate kinase/D-beta-D-heptose 1-phosphate adenosyltransferase
MIELLQRFPGCPVLVVGDLMLDEFLWGHVSRISPEAPVPVVEVQRRTYTAGGAANTAANLAALGAKVSMAGIVGDDAAGRQIGTILGEQGIATKAIVVDASRPTTTKTRVVAHSQQMVRIDHEKPGTMDAGIEEALLDATGALLGGMKACVVSDYGKGVVSPSFVARLIAAARNSNVPVIVDPKGTDYLKYRGASLVKPNQLEAGKVLNRDLKTTEEVDAAGRDLQHMLGGDTSILVTRGPHGMSLMEPNRTTIHIPTQAREVYDVTGAGDTVAATLALSMAVGANLESACKLASLAAAVVVGKVGTATCNSEELEAATRQAKW